jgi:AraC-like DNA-binding protein
MLKPSFEQIANTEKESSLKSLMLDLPSFEPFWHYHPEYELTYIIRGSGKRIVGDNIESFREGDLVLLGSNLPHSWNSEKSLNDAETSKAVVFQFRSKLIPDASSGFPEFEGIHNLLQLAQRGVSFHNQHSTATGKNLIKLFKASDFEKLTGFWLILNQLSKLKGHNLLASESYLPSLNKHNMERINAIFVYVAKHFAENISISTAARLTHLTDSSFCRFFKSVTGQSFTEYLNAIRISHFCKLLSEHPETSIPQLAYQSGFNSTTHYNRIFQQIKGCTPSDFRKQFLKMIET